MFTTEEKLVIALSIIMLIVFYYTIRNTYQVLETYKPKKTQNKIGGKSTNKIVSEIGQAKTIRLMNIFPVAPLLAVPFRDHVTQWIVQVPLTPFKAPLVVLPRVETLYTFLLYKPELLTPIRNQGDCGSCWAFSTCDVLADRAAIQSGGLFNENLSVQELLSCFNPSQNGCDGASPEDAFMFLAQKRITLGTERKMPYKQTSGGTIDTKCPRRIKGSQIGVKPDSVRTIVEWINETSPDPQKLKQNILNMKRELILGGPFYCAMTVYDDLYSFNGIEVYKRNRNASIVGGHAIQIIGYCDKGVDTRKGFNEDAYWICRNSWGINWPLQTDMSGYFTVQMGTNMCGIESRCGFAEPELFLENSFAQKKTRTLNDIRYTNYDDYIN